MEKGAVKYNSGNLDKYKSGNPLKKKLIERFDAHILALLESFETTNVLGEKTKLLDAGCGEGIVTAKIKNHFPNWNVVGIDGAKEAIKLAKEYFPGNIRFQIGNLYDLPYESDVFDVSICSEVLEHLTDPEKAIAELTRVTKTALLLTVPHEPWFCLGNFLSGHNVTRLGNPEDHINHWTHSGFKKFLNKTAQEKWTCVEYFTSFPWTIAMARNT